MDPVGWIVIAVIFFLLLVVAGSLLSADLLRGALGGGHVTLERAEKLLVVSSDDATHKRASEWATRHTATHPHATCAELRLPGEQQFADYEGFQRALAEHEPDAVVWALHDSERHSHETAYAMAKRELGVPMDAIYVMPAHEEQSA